MASDFGTARNVVRSALELLREEGVVARIQGSGTYAAAPRGHHRVDVLKSLEESFGSHVTREVLAFDEISAPRSVAVRLGIAPGARCVFLERIGRVDGYPVSVSASYFRGDLFVDLDRSGLEGDFYSILAGQLDGPLGTADVTLDAVPSDIGLADLFGVGRGHRCS